MDVVKNQHLKHLLIFNIDKTINDQMVHSTNIQQKFTQKQYITIYTYSVEVWCNFNFSYKH